MSGAIKVTIFGRLCKGLTLFHSTNVPLLKWFWAIYLTATDKSGISALRLAKHLGVSWPAARKMLKKIRMAMADRGSVYKLHNFIELDDAYVGGKRTGKRGRGAARKRPIVAAVEAREKKAGFMAVEAVDVISKNKVREFLQRHLKEGQTVRTDAFPALNPVSELHDHQKKLVPVVEEASK